VFRRNIALALATNALMSCIRSPWCVITVLAEYRRRRADFKIKSTSCGLKPRNSSMFWASAETKLQRAHVSSLLPTHPRIGPSRNRKRAEENLVLNYLDSAEPRNTVRFNRLMLQGPDEHAYRASEIGAILMSGYSLYGRGVTPSSIGNEWLLLEYQRRSAYSLPFKVDCHSTRSAILMNGMPLFIP